MTEDFEDAVRGSLQVMVDGVDAEPDLLEQAVTRRVSASRKRRRSALMATGVVATVALAIGTPVVVLQHTGRGDRHPADPATTLRPKSPTSYGERLVSMVELPSGGTSVEHSPIRWLNHPEWKMSLSPDPRRVTRWWTYDRSAESVWAFVSKHKSPGLTWDGTSGSGFPVVPRTRPPTSSVELRPSSGLPTTFVLGEVTVAVASLGHNRSGLAVVATVEPRRSISVEQQVPTAGARAVVAWRHAPGSPLVHTTLTGTASARLASALNELPKSILGVHSCPPLLPQNEVTVTFTAPGHIWRAVLDGCFDLSVSRDGAPLAVLSPIAPPAHGVPSRDQLFESELQSHGIRLPWER